MSRWTRCSVWIKCIDSKGELLVLWVVPCGWKRVRTRGIIQPWSVLPFFTIPYFHSSIPLILWIIWLSRVLHEVSGTWCFVLLDKDHNFLLVRQSCCSLEGEQKTCTAPSSASQGSCSQKTFRSISHKGAERLQWVLEGRCHSPLSWASSGTGAVLMGLVSLWANPRSMWQQHQEEVFSQCRRLSSCWRGTAVKSHKSFCLNETWDGLCRIDCFSTHSGCSTMSLTLRAGNRAFHGTV